VAAADNLGVRPDRIGKRGERLSSISVSVTRKIFSALVEETMRCSSSTTTMASGARDSTSPVRFGIHCILRQTTECGKGGVTHEPWL
jgi:hypothetical protein